MMSPIVFFVCLLLGTPGVNPAILQHSQQAADVEPVTLEIHSPIGRFRRSLRDTTPPDDLHLVVTSHSDVLSLHVQRTRRHVTVPKIYSATEKGFVKEELVQTAESIFYVNDTDKTAITLNWNNMTSQKFYGSFLKDNHVHLIQPDFEVTHASPGEIGPHVVSKMELLVDYFRDAVVIQDGINSPQKDESQRISRERREATRNRKHNAEGSRISETQRRIRGRRHVIKNNLFVEYGIVADFKNYQRWLSTTNSSLPDSERDYITKTRMVEFYGHVVNSVDAIFKSADSERHAFNIIMSGIVIFNETNSPPWTHHHALCPGCNIVDDYEVLRQFADWSKQFLQNIIPHDHATLFTGFDLYYKDLNSPKTIGLSFLSRMCGNWSVSVVEEKMNALTVHVAAHELGHNFGASHDGSQNADMCSAADLNLMASKMSRVTDETKARNPWEFSPCSRHSIYDYVDKITRERRNCLLGVPAMQNRNFLPQPGLVYSADEQCQNSYGNRSRVCRNYHHDDWKSMCYGLACFVPERSECHVIFPHDGTPCGYQKWCIRGLCVNSSTAEKVSDKCPHGDDPFVTCTLLDCRQGSGRHGDCCHYCQHMKTITSEDENSIPTSTPRVTTTDASSTSQSSQTTKYNADVTTAKYIKDVTNDIHNTDVTTTRHNTDVTTTRHNTDVTTARHNTDVTTGAISSKSTSHSENLGFPSTKETPKHGDQDTSQSITTKDTITLNNTQSTTQTIPDRQVLTPNLQASVGVFLSLVVLL